MPTATEQQAAATASDDVSYTLPKRLFRAAAQSHQTLCTLIFMAYVIILSPASQIRYLTSQQGQS